MDQSPIDPKEAIVTVREPTLESIPVLELRPTQITVRMREVKARRAAWKEREAVDRGKAREFLGKHMIPVILGPKERRYAAKLPSLCPYGRKRLKPFQIERAKVVLVLLP